MARIRRASAVAVLASLALAATAGGAPAWVPEEQLSGPAASGASDPRVALAARGDAVAAWLSADDSGTQRVTASLRTVASLAWAPAELISPSGVRALTPRVAMGPSGEAVAVWQAGTAVQASVRPAGAPAWGPPQTLSSGGAADSPRVAVTPSGAMIAVWRGADGELRRIQAAARPAGGDAFGPASVLSGQGEATSEPELAAGAAGAVAVWRRAEGGGGTVRAALLSAAGEWTPPRGLSDAGTAVGPPRAAVGDGGEAVAAWLGRSGGIVRVQAAVGSVGEDAWEPATSVSPAAAGAADADVGIAADGTAVALWSLPVAGVRRIQAATRAAATAQWGTPESLSAPGLQASDPDLGTNASGAAVAAWRSAAATPGLEVYAAARAPGGAWAAPALLGEHADSGVHADVSLDAAGNAVTVWEDGVIRARGYDAAGPVLTPAVPATAAPGQVLALSATARDLWSLGAGPPLWSFGDGTPSRTGAALTHAFAAPGLQRVTVTAEDALGNVSTAERTVVVSGAGPGGGPLASATGAGATSPAAARRAVRAVLVAGTRPLPAGRVRLVAAGRLVPVRGPRLGRDCGGRVVVSVRAGRRLVASGATRPRLRRGVCVYRRDLVLRPPRGARRLTVRAAFAGGRTLAPARSRAAVVRLR